MLRPHAGSVPSSLDSKPAFLAGAVGSSGGLLGPCPFLLPHLLVRQPRPRGPDSQTRSRCQRFLPGPSPLHCPGTPCRCRLRAQALHKLFPAPQTLCPCITTRPAPHCFLQVFAQVTSSGKPSQTALLPFNPTQTPQPATGSKSSIVLGTIQRITSFSYLSLCHL